MVSYMHSNRLTPKAYMAYTLKALQGHSQEVTDMHHDAIDVSLIQVPSLPDDPPHTVRLIKGRPSEVAKCYKIVHDSSGTRLYVHEVANPHHMFNTR